MDGGRNVWRWSVARSICLLISGRQVLQRKKGPIEHSSRFLEKFRGPRAAGATEVASNGATGAGAVSPGNKLLNRAVPAQCNARYADGRTVVNERHGFIVFRTTITKKIRRIERDDEGFTIRQPYLSCTNGRARVSVICRRRAPSSAGNRIATPAADEPAAATDPIRILTQIS